jgi:hypothetical protein
MVRWTWRIMKNSNVDTETYGARFRTLAQWTIESLEMGPGGRNPLSPKHPVQVQAADMRKRAADSDGQRPYDW